MKKLSALIIAVIFAMAFASYVYAGSADARTASTGKGISQVNGLGDLSSGNTAEIDSDGNVYTRSGSATVVSSTGATLNTGTAIVGAACNVESITISGVGTSAGDYVLIYDALTATGTPKFEITAATAKETLTIPTYGAAFATSVFADSNADNVFLSVVYH